MSGNRWIGDNHFVRIAVGASSENTEYEDVVVSLIINHLTPDGKPHRGSLTLRQANPIYYVSGGKVLDLWDVINPAPPQRWFATSGIKGITLSPSILCKCGDHGWIRDGLWVAA